MQRGVRREKREGEDSKKRGQTLYVRWKEQLTEIEKESKYNEINVNLICLDVLAMLCSLNANKANEIQLKS